MRAVGVSLSVEIFFSQREQSIRFIAYKFLRFIHSVIKTRFESSYVLESVLSDEIVNFIEQYDEGDRENHQESSEVPLQAVLLH